MDKKKTLQRRVWVEVDLDGWKYFATEYLPGQYDQ